MELFTKSRDRGELYSACASYTDGVVIVKRGSKINRQSAPGFNPKKAIATMRADDSLFENECYLSKDVSFTSLSMAATFVTGRSANGMIVWKTQDGKYVKYALQQEGE